MVASEMFTSNQSSEATNPLGSISILVVDDDATCLFLVAMMLRSWKYEVVTAQHARDALTALRVSGGSIDLVVTDVHMPDMNGFELQKQIDKEFNLPVVFMSVDDQESMILRGLESGGALYIVKPVLLDDLKNLWQHTISRRNKGKVVVQEFNGGNESSQSSNQGIDSALSANQDSPSVKVSKRKNKNRVGSYNYKNKVVWSKALHNKFLEAIRSLGLDRAVPKTILEHMNVRGLTRENVASHLQKYRMFLKRIAELSDKLESSSQRSIIKRTLQTNFASELPPSMSNGIFRLDYGGHVPLIGAPIVNQPSSSKHEAPLPRLWSGQSSLLLNQANSTQPLSQGHNLSLRYDPGHRTRSSLQANTLSGLVTGSSGYTIHQANLLGLRSNSSPQTSSSLQVDTLGAFMSGSSDTNHPANFPQTRSSLQMSTLSGLKSGLSGHTNRHAKLPGLRTDLSPQTNSSLLRNTLKSLLGDPISNTNSFPVYNSMASGVQGNDNTTSNRRMENLGISRLNPNTNQCPNSYLGSSLDGQSRLLRFGGRGDAGAESAEESKGSMSYGNMSSGDNLCQSVSSFAELQSAAIRFSPTSSCIDQQGKSQTLPEWQKTFDNVGATDQNLILTNDNVSSSSPNSFLPPNNEVDGCVTFPNQFTIEAPTQVEDWRGCQNAAVSFCSHPMEDNPQVNEQPPQQQADDEVLIPNLSHWTELDEFFPPFELNGTPSLQDDQEFLEAIFGAE